MTLHCQTLGLDPLCRMSTSTSHDQSRLQIDPIRFNMRMHMRLGLRVRGLLPYALLLLAAAAPLIGSAQQVLPAPLAYFPLNGSPLAASSSGPGGEPNASNTFTTALFLNGTSTTSDREPISYSGMFGSEASWADDFTMGISLLCNRSVSTTAGADPGIVVDHEVTIADPPPYGAMGALTISFWAAPLPPPSDSFQYLFSHGSGDPSIWSPNNIDVYLADSLGGTAGPLLRAVLSDGGTPPAGSGSAPLFLDSDGLISDDVRSNAASNAAASNNNTINFYDGGWHMITLTTLLSTSLSGTDIDIDAAQAERGFKLYLDGALSGSVSAAAIAAQGLPPNVTSSGGLPVSPQGPIYLCGRSNGAANRRYRRVIRALEDLACHILLSLFKSPLPPS